MDKTEEAQITGYSMNTIRGYIKTGKLKAQLVNNRYQIPQEEAERVFRVGKSINTDTNLITELRNRILQETIKLLTIKQLPGNQKGVNKRVFHRNGITPDNDALVWYIKSLY